MRAVRFARDGQLELCDELRVALDAAVLSQRIGISLGAEGVEQLGRAFDIGEEEGDRPRW